MPTLIAVIVVMAAGVAAAVLIGGDDATATKTVTVVAKSPTITVTETSGVGAFTPPSPPTTTATATTSSPPPDDDGERTDLDETRVTVDDSTSSTAANDEVVTLRSVEYGALAQLQQGSERNGSMTFDFGTTCCGGDYAADYYEFEITVPEHAARFLSEMGFLKGEATGNGVKVAFYRNEYAEGQALLSRSLNSASEVAPVDIDVTGMSKLIVRMTCTNRSHRWRTPSGDTPSFGFLDAHFE